MGFPCKTLLRLCTLMLALGLRGSDFMPLEEVQAGMTGYWETVVSGTEVERFHFEVVGIVPHFIGPQRAAILARATDESQILSGPVSGMSGSPCYIDGRLIGAYAYGFTWPKQQTLIGITPIADMMETLDKEGLRVGASSETPAAPRSGQGESWQRRLAAWGDTDKIRELLATGDSRFARHDNLRVSEDTDFLWAPTPMLSSGMSAAALEPFASLMASHGWVPLAGPAPGYTPGLTAADVGPGSALAAVLMDGDFRFAAVGTVTWREGDRLLAFGHPFMSLGDVSIPMAPAEVVVVVQSLARSFKLSNVGPIAGSLRQDRLSAVAGDLSLEAPVTPVAYRLGGPAGVAREYHGRVLRDRTFTPMLTSIALLQTLLRTMETADELTYRYRARFTLEDGEFLELQRTATGDFGPLQLALGQWLTLSLLADNPFRDGRFQSMDISLDIIPGIEQSSLAGVRVLSGQARSGEDYEVALVLNHYHGEQSRQRLTVPIPRGLVGEEVTLFIGDAAAANRLDGRASLATVNSFESLLDAIRNQRGNDRLYVKLLRPLPGLRLEGESLPGLPPSVSLLMDNPRNRQVMAQDAWLSLWETSLEMPGVFEGSHFMTIKVN